MAGCARILVRINVGHIQLTVSLIRGAGEGSHLHVRVRAVSEAASAALEGNGATAGALKN